MVACSFDPLKIPFFFSLFSIHCSLFFFSMFPLIGRKESFSMHKKVHPLALFRSLSAKRNNDKRHTRAFKILLLLLIFQFFFFFLICVCKNLLNNFKFKLGSLILWGPAQIPFKICTKTMRIRNVSGTNL